MYFGVRLTGPTKEAGLLFVGVYKNLQKKQFFVERYCTRKTCKNKCCRTKDKRRGKDSGKGKFGVGDVGAP